MAKIIKTLMTGLGIVNYGGQVLHEGEFFTLDTASLVKAQLSQKLNDDLMATPALANISTEDDPTELTGQAAVDLLMTSDI